LSSGGTLTAAGAAGGRGGNGTYTGGAGGSGGGSTGYSGSPSVLSASVSSTTLSSNQNGSISVTQNTGGVLTFSSTVQGSYALTVIAATADGVVNLGSSIGASSAPTSLLVKGSEITIAGAVTTSGTQTYNGPLITLSASTTLTSSTATFNGAVSGAYGLSVIGNAVFGNSIDDTVILTGTGEYLWVTGTTGIYNMGF
jgi:hypothetical protein